jgi:hypothetical protein
VRQQAAVSYTHGRMNSMIVIDGILYALASLAAGFLTAYLTGLQITAVNFLVFEFFLL